MFPSVVAVRAPLVSERVCSPEGTVSFPWLPAETSVTIDGIRFVVDSGKHKEMAWNPKTGECTVNLSGHGFHDTAGKQLLYLSSKSPV